MNPRWELRIACFNAISERHKTPHGVFRSHAGAAGETTSQIVYDYHKPTLTEQIVEAEALEKWVLSTSTPRSPGGYFD